MCLEPRSSGSKLSRKRDFQGRLECHRLQELSTTNSLQYASLIMIFPIFVADSVPGLYINRRVSNNQWQTTRPRQRLPGHLAWQFVTVGSFLLRSKTTRIGKFTKKHWQVTEAFHHRRKKQKPSVYTYEGYIFRPTITTNKLLNKSQVVTFALPSLLSCSPLGLSKVTPLATRGTKQ